MEYLCTCRVAVENMQGRILSNRQIGNFHLYMYTLPPQLAMFIYCITVRVMRQLIRTTCSYLYRPYCMVAKDFIQ